MKTIPFWQENTPRPDELPSHELPAEVDVLIIGGGYSGLCAAITLAKSGASVAVLEKETIGWGSASRNGGFVTGVFGRPDELEKSLGLEKARELWNWSLAAVQFVEDMVKDEGIDCDFITEGNLLLAYKPSHVDYLLNLRDLLASKFDDHRYKFVPREHLPDEIGSNAFHAGILDENGTGLDPAKFVYGLAKAAARYGVQLVERAEVTKAHRTADGFTVLTPKGQVHSQEVLIATNGYTGFLVPKIRYGVILGGGYCCVTEPLSEELYRDISPKGRGFFDSRFFFNYFRPIPGRRLLLGGWKTLVRDKDPQLIGRKLQGRIMEIFPQLQGVEVTHAWTGQFAFTFDMLPHIGQVDGIHYAVGCNGHGVGTMSYLGYQAAQLMSGQIDYSLFANIKHPRYFFAPLDRIYWPLVNTWFRFQDWIS